VSQPRVSEWIAGAYFAYLFAAAWIVPPWPRRRAAAAASLVAAVAAGLLSSFWPAGPRAAVVRDWLPALYLVVGYWLSGWYFAAPMAAVERRFLAIDGRVLGCDKGAALVDRLPRPVLEMLELAYVTCFLFVPGGLLVLTLAGHRDAADRFWTLVLLGELGSFGVLPWIQTRPPRLIEPPGALDRRGLLMRRMNRLQIETVSIGVNTFPSGHVAGSLATAIAVGERMPVLAPWLLAAAALISIAAVLGRYHYVIDAVAGVLLALLAWGVTAILWR